MQSDESLIEGIEEVFGIIITQEECGELFKVADLQSLVLKKFDPATQQGCLTNIAFYRLRRAIMKAWGIPRHLIGPETDVAGLITKGRERPLWCSLEHALGMTLPHLQYNPSIVTLNLGLFLGGLLLLFAACLLYAMSYADFAFILFPFLIGITLLLLSTLLAMTEKTNRWATEVPTGYKTVGSAARELVTWNYASLSKDIGRWSEDEVSEVVRNIVACVAYVEPDEIRPELRIADLLTDS